MGSNAGSPSAKRNPHSRSRSLEVSDTRRVMDLITTRANSRAGCRQPQKPRGLRAPPRLRAPVARRGPCSGGATLAAPPRASPLDKLREALAGRGAEQKQQEEEDLGEMLPLDHDGTPAGTEQPFGPTVRCKRWCRAAVFCRLPTHVVAWQARTFLRVGTGPGSHCPRASCACEQRPTRLPGGAAGGLPAPRVRHIQGPPV